MKTKINCTLLMLAAMSAGTLKLSADPTFQDTTYADYTIASGTSYSSSLTFIGNSTTTWTIDNEFADWGVFQNSQNFVPNGQWTITGANVFFYISNLYGSTHVAQFNLDQTAPGSSSNLSNWTPGDITFDDGLNSAQLSFLNNNGSLNYTITNTGPSDFTLMYSRLTMTTEVDPPVGGQDGPAPAVPDSGSTLTLLGFVVTGLAAVRRKFTS